MKKLTALIISLCMCISFIPALPVAAAAEATDASDGIVYNLVPDKKNGMLWEFTEDKVDGYYTNPNWSFFDMAPIYEKLIIDAAELNADTENGFNEGYTPVSGLTAETIKAFNTRMLHGSKGNYFRMYNVTGNYSLQDYETWFALKLDNPGKAGRYSIDIGRNDSDTKQLISLWLAPYEDGHDDAEYYMTDAKLVAKNQLFNNNAKTGDVSYDIEITNPDVPYVFVMKLGGVVSDFRINSIILREQANFDFRSHDDIVTNNTVITTFGEETAKITAWYYLDMHESIKTAVETTPNKARVLTDKMQIGAVVKNQWVALGLKNIKRGIYSVNLDWMARTSSSADANIYFAKILESVDAESLMTDANLIESGFDFANETDETLSQKTLSGVCVADGKSDYAFIIKSNDTAGRGFEPRKLIFNPIAINSLALDIPDTSLEKGDTVKASVTANGSIAATEAATFASDNENAIKISDDGTITAVGAGTAKITAEVNGITATETVTVTADAYTLTYDFKISSFEYNKMPRKNVNDSSFGGIRISNAENVKLEDLSDVLNSVLVVNKSLLSWKNTLSKETDFTDTGAKDCEPYYVLNSTLANGADAKTEPWAFEYASATALNTRSNEYGLWSQLNTNRFVDFETVSDHVGGTYTMTNDVAAPLLFVRLYVANPGLYDLSFINDFSTNSSYRNQSSCTNVYFGKAPTATVKAATADATLKSLDYVGIFNGPKYNKDGAIINEEAIKITEAGEYLIAFEMTADTYAMNSCKTITGSTSKTYSYDKGRYLQYLVFDTIELIPAEAPVEEEEISQLLSFAAYSGIDGKSVDVSGIDYNGDIDSELRGSNVTVSAPEIDGYVFRYWKRGSADNGKWVSSDKEYTFSLMTNTVLTAVYDEVKEDATAQIVEFWNQNGVYITSETVSGGTVKLPANPTLTGHTFNNWYVNEDELLDVSKLTEVITRAVARHTANKISGNVKVNGNAVSDVEYNKEITTKASDAKVWMRDGKKVAYGDTYTYYVWDETEITYSTEAVSEKLPLVVLEEGNGAYMIEYDAGDKELVEAGIVFGSGATVSSCSEKATSQRKVTHGQFTATSDYTDARGYVIYKDGTDYKVIYSE